MARSRRRLGSPPLPAGHWPTGRKRAAFCRALERIHQTCGRPGSVCRENAEDRALAVGCKWVNKFIRPYGGRRDYFDFSSRKGGW